MPYHWTPDHWTPDHWNQDNSDIDHIRLDIWPHRSMPLEGFAKVILLAFALGLIPLLAVLGTMLLWGLLPFMLLALAGLWWGLRRSYHDAKLHEVLIIGPDDTRLTRTAPNGQTQDWRANSYWIRANLHPTQGPVPFYITLTGQGREVELGAFLSEDERKLLYGELSERLSVVAGR